MQQKTLRGYGVKEIPLKKTYKDRQKQDLQQTLMPPQKRKAKQLRNQQIVKEENIFLKQNTNNSKIGKENKTWQLIISGAT